MNRGDIKLAYDRAIAHDVPDVADRLCEMAERISALEAHNAVLLEVMENIPIGYHAKITGRDCGCSTCQSNRRVQKALASTPESSLADIRRAEWQPIETAPKDGSEVLLYLGNPWNKVEKACWYEPWKNWQAGTIPDDPAREEYGGIGSALPTNWMPLPNPPAIRQMED